MGPPRPPAPTRPAKKSGGGFLDGILGSVSKLKKQTSAKPKALKPVELENPVVKYRKDFKKMVEDKLKKFADEEGNELEFNSPEYSQDDVLRHIIHETAEDMGFSSKNFGDQNIGERVYIIVYKEAPEEAEVEVEERYSHRDAMRDAANVEYTGQSTKSKLAAGLNATVSQQGNEYTRVETGAGGAQFVAVGVKKRDRRSVEEIEAEMKREREGAGKDESGDANGDAKRAKTEGPAAE